MREEPDMLQQDLEENTNADAEDPYRGLKIAEKIVWFIIVLFIAINFLVWLSDTAFSTGTEWGIDNADFS